MFFLKKDFSYETGALRNLGCKLRPVIRNATRWSSTFEMVERFNEMCDHIKQLAKDNKDLKALMLSFGEEDDLLNLSENLKSLHSVTLALQSMLMC